MKALHGSEPDSDVNQRAGSNQGHVFGTHLPDQEKDTLVEYLKTL